MQATKLAKPAHNLRHCRQTTIEALISESLSQLEAADASAAEIQATRDYVRAAVIARAVAGDRAAAMALLTYWVEG